MQCEITNVRSDLKGQDILSLVILNYKICLKMAAILDLKKMLIDVIQMHISSQLTQADKYCVMLDNWC